MIDKQFKIEVSETKKGFLYKSSNKGFTALEIIGLLSSKIHDIQHQMSGDVKPKIRYDRTVIVKKKKKK